jgi:hypothetical protein
MKVLVIILNQLFFFYIVFCCFQLLYVVQRVVLLRRMPIRTSHAIRPGEVLTIIHRKMDMVLRVMRRSIDDVLERMTGDHVRIVNEYGPEIDSDEEGKVERSL